MYTALHVLDVTLLQHLILIDGGLTFAFVKLQ